jgi:hypothetical protein
MLTAFMVTVTVVTSGLATGDWWETHLQHKSLEECRLGQQLAEQLGLPPLHGESPSGGKWREVKQFCQMESYGPNYSIVHYHTGEIETKTLGWEVY